MYASITSFEKEAQLWEEVEGEQKMILSLRDKNREDKMLNSSLTNI